MLRTNLEHLETNDAMNDVLNKHENVVICCGRMGSMCLPVYATMSRLRKHYTHVQFFDQDFDGAAATRIRNLPECAGFMGLPFIVYFKKGKVVKATSGTQSGEKVADILDREFARPV